MADVKIEDQGSLVVFRLEGLPVQYWVEENVDIPDFAWLGGTAFVVEHRYADNLIEGLRGEGFEVEYA